MIQDRRSFGERRARLAGGVFRTGLAMPVLGVAVVALTSCGASAGAGASRPTAGVSAANGGSASTGKVGVCEKVSAPAPRRQQHIPSPHTRLDPSKRYVVTLATNCGPIAIQLDVRDAPRTSASFAYLVRRGFYNDLTFHRVATNFVIQGGDPNGDGSGGPGYTIVERPPANLRYTQGTVAMAKTNTDPAGASGSQFFIVTTSEAPLPAQYALVGRVVGSFAGVNSIAALPTNPPQDGAPKQPVVISRATLSVS